MEKGRRVEAETALAAAAEESEAGALAKYAELVSQHGGLCRTNLTSDAWHLLHPTAAPHLFGFRSWEETKAYLFILWPELEQPAPGAETAAMCEYEKCLIAKMRMHQAFKMETLSATWDRDATVIGRYIQEWAPKWGEAGKDFSILDISKGFLARTLPQKYKDAGMTNICGVPDGKDFMTDVIRSNTMMTRAGYSDKVHHSGVRCISWGTPRGLSYEHTVLYLARCTEQRLVELWGPRLEKCPEGMAMLSDRGFAGTARLYPNFNAQLTPKFLMKRLQFTAGEVSSDRELCKLRYTCEVAFARVVEEAGLKDVITYGFWNILDAMNHWGHANVNLHSALCL